MDFKTKMTTYLLLFVVSFFSNAQEKKKSPAESVKGNINGSEISINYGAPSVRGRVIWGDLVPYGKIWRAGANEATTFETSKDITIAGKKLPAGKYSFFVIPEKDQATVIFNKDTKLWGDNGYKESGDVLRVNVKTLTKPESTEKLTYTIGKADVSLDWDKARIYLPVQ